MTAPRNSGRLEQIRTELDGLDQRIVELLNQRARLSTEVGRIKQGRDIIRPAREKELLDALLAANPGPLTSGQLTAIYREILSSSRQLQGPGKVACLGPEGSFSHQAGQAFLGASTDFLLLPDFPSVFEAVVDKRAETGLIPLENSLNGSVGQNFDLFLTHQVYIIAEMFLPVSLSLLSKASKLSEVLTVCSHYQPLAQCAGWLRRNLPQARLEAVESTALAARKAAEAEESAGLAAIAHQSLAERLGLSILGTELQDLRENWTRFVLISARRTDEKSAGKTSMVFTLPNQPGALAMVLDDFARHGINLKKLESRPVRGERWQYVFFVDVEIGPGHANYARLLEELKLHCHFLRVLGSYPEGAYLEK